MNKILLIFIVISLFSFPCLSGQETIDTEELNARDIQALQEIIKNRIKSRNDQIEQEIEGELKKRSITGIVSTTGQGGFFRLLFLISLNLLILNLIFLILNQIGNFEFPDIVNKLNIGMLVFSIAPVLAGLFSLFTGITQYLMLFTLAIWFLMLIGYYLIKRQNMLEDEKLIKQGDLWRCSKCRRFNDKIYVKCQQCDADR